MPVLLRRRLAAPLGQLRDVARPRSDEVLQVLTVHRRPRATVARVRQTCTSLLCSMSATCSTPASSAAVVVTLRTGRCGRPPRCAPSCRSATDSPSLSAASRGHGNPPRWFLVELGAAMMVASTMLSLPRVLASTRAGDPAIHPHTFRRPPYRVPTYQPKAVMPSFNGSVPRSVRSRPLGLSLPSASSGLA